MQGHWDDQLRSVATLVLEVLAEQIGEEPSAGQSVMELAPR